MSPTHTHKLEHAEESEPVNKWLYLHGISCHLARLEEYKHSENITHEHNKRLASGA